MSDHGDDDNDAVSNALTTMLSDQGVKRKHESYADVSFLFESTMNGLGSFFLSLIAG